MIFYICIKIVTLHSKKYFFFTAIILQKSDFIRNISFWYIANILSIWLAKLNLYFKYVNKEKFVKYYTIFNQYVSKIKYYWVNIIFLLTGYPEMNATTFKKNTWRKVSGKKSNFYCLI